MDFFVFGRFKINISNKNEIEKVITCGHVPKKNESNGMRLKSGIILNTKTKTLDLC